MDPPKTGRVKTSLGAFCGDRRQQREAGRRSPPFPSHFPLPNLYPVGLQLWGGPCAPEPPNFNLPRSWRPNFRRCVFSALIRFLGDRSLSWFLDRDDHPPFSVSNLPTQWLGFKEGGWALKKRGGLDGDHHPCSFRLPLLRARCPSWTCQDMFLC